MILPSNAPSPWVLSHFREIPQGASVLDLACGSGRHVRLLAEAGYPVLAVDRDGPALAHLAGLPGVRCRQADLEGETWPLAAEAFAGIVVTNYLWRPRLTALFDLLLPGGILIYETFMVGNEAYGRPSNPDFLLRPGELKQVAAAAGLQVMAFSEGYRAEPKPAMVQGVVARR